MTGICLVCDKCGEELSGSKMKPAFNWSDERKLRKIAIELGWTGELTRQSDSDLCPKCSLIKQVKKK